MSILVRHGGNCCGMHHLYGFYRTETVEDIQRRLLGLPRQGMTVEIILTNSQLGKMSSLGKNIQKVGFRLVNRFKNPNSGAICNVFHYTPRARSLTKNLPFGFVAATAPVLETVA